MKTEKYKTGELVELVKNIFEEPHPSFKAGTIGVVMDESRDGKVCVRLGLSSTGRQLTSEELLREGNQSGMVRRTLLLDLDEIRSMAAMPNETKLSHGAKTGGSQNEKDSQ